MFDIHDSEQQDANDCNVPFSVKAFKESSVSHTYDIEQAEELEPIAQSQLCVYGLRVLLTARSRNSKLYHAWISAISKVRSCHDHCLANIIFLSDSDGARRGG